MEKHVHLVAILYLAFGALQVLGAIIIFVVIAGGGLISQDQEAIVITSSVATAISSLLLLTAIPGIIGTYGLFKRKEWSRILMMVLAALSLFSIPFGTMLGIYTFWVLLQEETLNYFEPNESGAKIVNPPSSPI